MSSIFEKKSLLEALKRAGRFVNGKSKLPILHNVLILNTGDEVLMFSNNLEVGFYTTIKAELKKPEPWSITLDHKQFLSAVSAMKTDLVSFEVLPNFKAKIGTDKMKTTLTGIDVQEFPQLPNIQNITKLDSISINHGQLESLIKKVAFATSDDEARPVMTGVQFVFETNKLTLNTTDGFRLSTYSMPIDYHGEKQVAIIPYKQLKNIMASLSGAETISFWIDTEKTQVYMTTPTSGAIIQIIPGNMPDFSFVTPKYFNLTITTERESLLDILDFLSSQTETGVKLDFSEQDKISLTTTPDDGEDITTETPATITGNCKEPFGYFYPLQLSDNLSAFHEKTVKIEFIHPHQPMKISFDGLDGYSLLMPVFKE